MMQIYKNASDQLDRLHTGCVHIRGVTGQMLRERIARVERYISRRIARRIATRLCS
jgi:hypothetical protein